MIQFDILTLFPEIFPGVLETSILGRAVKKGLLSFKYTNIRNYSKDKHNRVDDYPYGGGCGMVMQPGPIYDAYQDVIKDCNEKPLTVFLSPRGKTFNQEIAKQMSKRDRIVLVCGHYEGIDQRVIDEIADYELSVGDFVLTGGELGAMIVCDAISRLIPGVLAEEESFTGESHYNSLLEYPQYTRPPVWLNRTVPNVLLGGNQREIDLWRTEQSLIKTETVRPDLLDKTNYQPACVRTSVLFNSFKLIAYADSINRDEVYKLRRKLARKLENQGFNFEEISTVFTNQEKMQSFLKCENSPIVLVVKDSSYTESFNFNKPTLVLSENKVSSDMLYPYFGLCDTKTVCETTRNFLSILSILNKYTKK